MEERTLVFNKTLFVVCLLTMITGCSMEQYNVCVEKCGDSLADTCTEQCQTIVDKCYTVALSGSGRR